MLGLVPPDVNKALAKAADAREKARGAATQDERLFWERMEAKWLRCAETAAFVQRFEEYLASIKQSLRD